jgi:hypothetical protein
MTERDTTSPPPPPLDPVTLRVAVAEAAPGMLAVMVVVPAATAVARPDALTVAIPVALEDHVT